jgi:hypothetical protein
MTLALIWNTCILCVPDECKSSTFSQYSQRMPAQLRLQLFMDHGDLEYGSTRSSKHSLQGNYPDSSHTHQVFWSSSSTFHRARPGSTAATLQHSRRNNFISTFRWTLERIRVHQVEFSMHCISMTASARAHRVSD